MDTLELEVITPSGLIFHGNVASVTVPGEEGEFGVLAQHVGLTTLLKAGVVEIHKENGKKESIVINWGVVQVANNLVTVLVDGAGLCVDGVKAGGFRKSRPPRMRSGIPTISQRFI